MSEQRRWRELNQDEYPGVQVQVARVGGRLRITGVQVEDPDELRSLPVPRLEALLAAQFALEREQVHGLLTGVRGGRLSKTPKLPTKRELRLSIPKSRRYPDVFFAKVAGLYLALVANGRRPAPALAEANNVPVTQVHGWIKEARRRGLLAPARKGGATG